MKPIVSQPPRSELPVAVAPRLSVAAVGWLTLAAVFWVGLCLRATTACPPLSAAVRLRHVTSGAWPRATWQLQQLRQSLHPSLLWLARVGVPGLILLLVWLNWPAAVMAPPAEALSAAERSGQHEQSSATTMGISGSLRPAPPPSSIVGAAAPELIRPAAPATRVTRLTPSATLAAAAATAGGRMGPPAELEPAAEPMGTTLAAAPAPEPTPTRSPPTEPPSEPASPVLLGQSWPTFVPTPDADHYWLGPVFPPHAANQFATPLYQYGSTGGGKYLVHHGVDMANPMGTPLVAAAAGEVVHAGPDDPFLLGPYTNFYGNAVVIRLDRRLSTPKGEMDVFVLYAHLSDVTVQRGQQVELGDLVGFVGMTGIALGPHLHLEVRVGHNDYRSTVNPLLWLQPQPHSGSVAVRVLSADGRAWQGAKLSLLRIDPSSTTWVRTITTYLNTENINWDPLWGENGVMDALVAGTYRLVGKINHERVDTQLLVEAGRTTFVELRTAQ